MIDFSRKIQIIGDIDEEAYKSFVERMDECDEMLYGEEIFIELSSHGGDAMMALAFYDRIRSSKSEITIIGFGTVASAAVLILAAGDKRYLGQSAWVMVHEDQVSVDESARTSQLEHVAKSSRRLEDQWNKLLSSRTKVSADVWADLHKQERYLDAEDCKKLGLIDGVLK